MPTYTVRAQVIDVRSDTPRPSDRMLVDTNVWAWASYRGSQFTPSGSLVPQVGEYPPYVSKSRAVGATLLHVGASLAELAHVVERIEHQFYCAGVGPLSLKDYRHDRPAERASVTAEIEAVWGKVEADSTLLAQSLDAATLAAALQRLTTSPVDGYDLFLLEAMASGGVTQLLTDDGDFCCVSGIEVFTANPRVLAAAQAQGRLVVR